MFTHHRPRDKESALPGRSLFMCNTTTPLGSSWTRWIVNEHRLRQVLTEYLAHYNSARPHRALGQLAPAPADHPATGDQPRRTPDLPETSPRRTHTRIPDRLPTSSGCQEKTQVTRSAPATRARPHRARPAHSPLPGHWHRPASRHVPHPRPRPDPANRVRRTRRTEPSTPAQGRQHLPDRHRRPHSPSRNNRLTSPAKLDSILPAPPALAG